MDHAAHITEMRNVCQIFKRKCEGKHLEGTFIHGKKVSEKHVFKFFH
jgi:hypothetical protein